LKKIKQTKRAVDRAIVGFSESVVSESVHFEMKMTAQGLGAHAKGAKKIHSRFNRALSAILISDYLGLENLTEGLFTFFDDFSSHDPLQKDSILENSQLNKEY
jgi:hypothetical protein